jgi:hypothetical protein
MVWWWCGVVRMLGTRGTATAAMVSLCWILPLMPVGRCRGRNPGVAYLATSCTALWAQPLFLSYSMAMNQWHVLGCAWSNCSIYLGYWYMWYDASILDGIVICKNLVDLKMVTDMLVVYFSWTSTHLWFV